MKLRLVSDLPGVNPRTTQIEMLVMSLTALSSTFALRAASEAAGTFLGPAEEGPKRERGRAKAHGGGGA